jgi:hypothetical protein
LDCQFTNKNGLPRPLNDGKLCRFIRVAARIASLKPKDLQYLRRDNGDLPENYTPPEKLSSRQLNVLAHAG